MALVRWEPFREIDGLQKEMNRLFDRFVPETYGHLANGHFMPAAELSETEEAIDLKVEIPGMSPEDIDVQVTADSVAISGERKSETKTEKDGVTRSEFRYGRFQRVIPLPSRIQNTQVGAEYKDGVLTLHLPKMEEERNKVVKVNLG
ncbi:MAG TPA: Hsp20/alpha crystallin family protein [Trichocoleus sp.]